MCPVSAAVIWMVYLRRQLRIICYQRKHLKRLLTVCLEGKGKVRTRPAKFRFVTSYSPRRLACVCVCFCVNKASVCASLSRRGNWTRDTSGTRGQLQEITRVDLSYFASFQSIPQQTRQCFPLTAVPSNQPNMRNNKVICKWNALTYPPHTRDKNPQIESVGPAQTRSADRRT